MSHLLVVALGGAAGAVSRYAVSVVVAEHSMLGPHLATFIVNISGSLLLGVVAALAELTTISPTVRALVAIGFLGSFTTFSTWQLELFALARAGAWLGALGSLLVSVAVGFAAAAGGYMITRAILRTVAG